jgi:hypothetical protein
MEQRERCLTRDLKFRELVPTAIPKLLIHHRESLTFPSPRTKHTSMKYLPVILAIPLAACGVPKMVKPGVPQQEYAQDHYQCLRESQWTYTWSLLGIIQNSQLRYDSDLYSSCMEARGYAKE